MGSGHSAAHVERGAGQPEVAGVDVAGVPPGAAAGEGSRPGDADGGAVTRRAKGGPGKDAARAVSMNGFGRQRRREALALSPGGAAVVSQGRQPLESTREKPKAPEGRR